MNKVAFLGTVGIPARYGGFETLAENLVNYHHAQKLPGRMLVYCSAKEYPDRDASYLDAELHYVPINANGVSSIFYDVFSLFSALRQGTSVILLLGVSGATALPLIRLISKVRIVTNIDGIEWKREKWRGLAKWFLRISERFAVRFSHEVIADNQAIADYVNDTYHSPCHVIAYGGDHAIDAESSPYGRGDLPKRYALALCRIEPENNVEMILESFTQESGLPLILIGNWENSPYGRELRARLGSENNLHLLDPIYDLNVLHYLRRNCELYVHGHSAGGTNPSLVEMMHFGIPIFAFDCSFNRYTTENSAKYFSDAKELVQQIQSMNDQETRLIGAALLRIAKQKYNWDSVGSAYFQILLDNQQKSIS